MSALSTIVTEGIHPTKVRTGPHIFFNTRHATRGLHGTHQLTASDSWLVHQNGNRKTKIPEMVQESSS